jgi:hypothetical protein
MSKRNIRPNSGKQLYLNQIFYKGMLYTSSEMQEGFAKVIDNYDIAPTGDAASPRQPLKMINGQNVIDDNGTKYVVPVKFKQDEGKQSYVKFYQTVTEEDFVNDIIQPFDGRDLDIGIVKRSGNAINESIHFEDEISYTIVNQENNDIEDTTLKEKYKFNVENNEGLEIFDSGAFAYHQYYYDSKIGDIAIRYVDIPHRRFSGSQYNLDSLNFKDGDTFYINSEKQGYRLFGIDCTELGTEWSEYARITMSKIVNQIGYLGWNFISKNTDVYGRPVGILYLYFEDPDGDLQWRVDAAQLLLSLGLAVMRYIDRNTDPSLFDEYQQITNTAMTAGYKIFNTEDDFDPFYNKFVPNISVSEGNNLQITEGMHIEAVVIRDGFHISAVTQNNIDFVQTVYIDYLDSLAFMGRVISGSDIVYKGPILLRAQRDEDDNVLHTILLPSNQGEGVKPNLVEAATTNSYNLINNNMINIKNEEDENSAFNILGTTVVYIDSIKNNEPVIDINNPKILNQGIVGQSVLLKAIINEKGYYYSNEVSTTDNYGFNIVINPIVVKGHTLFPERTISRAVNEFTNITSDTYGLASVLAPILKDLTDEEKADFPETWEEVLAEAELSIKSITLVKDSSDDSQSIRMSGDEFIKVLSKNRQPLWEGSVLELQSQLKVDGDDLLINFHNNFSTINQTFNDEGALVMRGNTLPLEFYSRWSVAEYGGESFRDIQPEQLIYTKGADSNILTPVGDWTKDIKPVDYVHVLSGNTNLLFKFSIQPKIDNQLNNYCPNSLKDIYLVNTFQEMFMITPVVKLGAEIEVISDKDLRVNMAIKNATRLDVFNRQLCVYGPYTISNVLFFSKFETFDFFPFPSGVIELEEPITWVYNYKDAFIIFGKNHIHMLKGATTVSECTLHKIYENLSVHLPDVRVINTVGNNLIFFNNGVGYVIVPNTYVDSSSNIKVYKLTEYISNFFYNPELYIRNRIPDIGIESSLIYHMELDSYVQNNDIVITNNITVLNGEQEYHLVVWFIYNQDYKYWRMYSTTLFDRIIANYICEPNVNHQFVVSKDDTTCMSFFTNVYTLDYKDIDAEGNFIPIITMLNSGYLSVDTMNDKRFKDLIIELDNINPEAKLYLDCEFFVDGSPMLLSDTDALIIDKVSGAILESEKVLSEYKTFEAHHIGYPKDDTVSRSQNFGTTFKIDNKVYSMTGRTHIRIPVYGKGRLPAFTLKIRADKFYEFINYALIYKEKNINRRT